MITAVEEPPIAAPHKPNTQEHIAILQQTVSASRLSCWASCRLKFLFRYVQQILKPPTASLHVGSVVHEVLRAWNMARWRRQSLEVGQFKKVFDAGWADQPVNASINWENDEAALKNTAWSLLECYLTSTPIKADELPEAVEVPMETELSKHGLPKLIGILDLVQRGTIIDFKTSGRSPSAEDAIHQHEIQMSCYSVLYREATGKTEAGRELHHLIKTKVPRVIVTAMEPMNEIQQVRLFRMMDSYVEGLARQDFVPSPGIQCCGCEYFNECRLYC